MRLSVNPNDKTPIYRQLYEQIASQVLSGALQPGEALPPIRAVSRELGVSMITVRSAWDELIRDGYLVSRTGSGCFVARAFYSKNFHRIIPPDFETVEKR